MLTPDHDERWKYSSLLSDYVSETDQYPDARDGDWTNYSTVSMGTNANNRDGYVFFKCPSSSARVVAAKFKVRASTGGRVDVDVVERTGTGTGDAGTTISTSSHTVTTSTETITLTLDASYAASNNIQIRFVANGTDTVYIYDTAFLTLTGGALVIT